MGDVLFRFGKVGGEAVVCISGQSMSAELMEEMAGFEGVPLMPRFVGASGASVQ